ncbi:MAG: hypothetical protein ACXVCO_02140 [Ktedonobacterales bacterium]
MIPPNLSPRRRTSWRAAPLGAVSTARRFALPFRNKTPQPISLEPLPRSPFPPGEGDKGLGGFLVLIVVLAAAYFVPRGISWNADSHLFLTASIVDRGTLNIDSLAAYTGDKAFAGGHYYSDKAPGLSLLAVPVYAVLKYSLLGGHPYSSLFAVPEAQRIDFLVRDLLAVVFGAIPTGILTVLLASFLARFGLSERWRIVLALTYALGTIARPFAGQFFSHQLAALLIFGAFVLLYRMRHGELDARFAALAGLLLGYALITEYPTALIAAALTLYALTTPATGRRLAAWLAAGAIPPLLVGALYNTLAFGGPLSLGYAHLDGPQVFRTGQAQGIMGVTYPHLDALWQTTFGPYRGIFLISPLLLLAIPGFVALWRRVEWAAEARLWLAVVAVYGLFSVSYFAWDGGFSMGPRQFLPALPFLFLPIGELLRPQRDRRWRIAAAILAAWSILVVEAATAVGALFDPTYTSPLTQYVLPRLLAGQLDNNWGLIFGLHGLLQLIPLCLLIALILWRQWHKQAQRATLAKAAITQAGD